MFRIKFTVIEDLISLLHFHYSFIKEGSFVNIPHERLETEAYLEPDNSKSVFILKTNSFENNIRYEIDFPLNEEGIEKYVDYVIFKVEKEEQTKAFNCLYNVLNFMFGGLTLKSYLFNYHKYQFERKLNGSFKDATFEDTGILEKVDNYATDAINYFVETELERLKKEKNNMNKNVFLIGDYFPLLPKGIFLETGSRGGGKQLKQLGETIKKVVWDEFKTSELKGQEKLKQPRPDSIMIDEEHRIMVAFLGGKRFVAECHDGDKFDFKIGLGTIVSKCNDTNVELQYLRKKMKWNEYYLYCYNKFFYFNQDKIKAFENKVFAEKEQYKLRVNEEKVRKYKCELNQEKYRERKVTHNFIKI